MAKGKGKRLVYVPEDIMEGLVKASRREGEHLDKFVEQALRVAVDFSRMGYGPKKLALLFEAIQTHRIMGASIIPLDVLNYLTAKAYSIESQQVQAQWYESGRLYGKYLKEKFENPLVALENLLKMGKWELSSVEVKSEPYTVKVRCISAQLTVEGAETLAKFIEGAMNSLGFKTKSIECLKGMAILEFLQNPPHD
jgi:hypothetical protein